MTNERIDHAAEARLALEWLSRRRRNVIREEGPLVVAAAQVHATLALVEQQRIANLLRSGAIGGGPMNDHTRMGAAVPAEGVARHRRRAGRRQQGGALMAQPTTALAQAGAVA